MIVEVIILDGLQRIGQQGWHLLGAQDDAIFAMAWKDLREKAGSPDHERICRNCHDRLADLVATQLPTPGGLSSEALRRAAQLDAGLGEVLQVCRLFQWLIPGLIVNVAYFRHQLESI